VRNLTEESTLRV